MNIDQPEASSSTSPPPAQHLVSFVVDSALSREKYVKLVEPDGVVHSLVQRLMEKHGGETNLLISTVLLNQVEGRFPALSRDFKRPSTFLTSLPGLAKYLPKGEAISWPVFSDTTNLEEDERGRKEKGELINGVINGLEMLAHRPSSKPQRTLLHELSPPSAEAIIDSLFDPGTTNAAKYLIVVAAEPTELSTKAVSSANWDTAWDRKSWEELGTMCMEKDIAASCVVVGSGGVLEQFCQATSSEAPENPWFAVPRNVHVHLSGFALADAPPSPSAPNVPDFTAPPALALETNPAKMQAMQGQAMALRMLQARANQTGSPLNNASIAQFLAAAKGNLDPNSPTMQQFKAIMQQPRSQQGGQPSGNADQLLLAAMRQQMLQQAQSGGQQQGVLPQQQRQPDPTQRQTPKKIWGGAITWQLPDASGATNQLHLMVEAATVSGNLPDAIPQSWPQELAITYAINYNISEVQNYAKVNRCPCMLFTPTGGSTDPSASKRYNHLAVYLQNKLGIVPMGQSDLGLGIFSTSQGTSTNGKAFRLMALVCLNAPLPLPNRQQPSQMPTSIPPHQMNQPQPVTGIQMPIAVPPQQYLQSQNQAVPQRSPQTHAQVSAQPDYRQPAPTQNNYPQPPVQFQPSLPIQPQQMPNQVPVPQMQNPQQQQQQQPRRYTSVQAQMLHELARNNNIDLPDGMDFNALPDAQRQQIVNIIQTAENGRKGKLMQLQQQQQQQFQQQQQQQQQQQAQPMMPNQFQPQMPMQGVPQGMLGLQNVGAGMNTVNGNMNMNMGMAANGHGMVPGSGMGGNMAINMPMTNLSQFAQAQSQGGGGGQGQMRNNQPSQPNPANLNPMQMQQFAQMSQMGLNLGQITSQMGGGAAMQQHYAQQYGGQMPGQGQGQGQYAGGMMGQGSQAQGQGQGYQ